MEFPDLPANFESPTFQYEYASLDSWQSTLLLKQKAFSIMDRLEGWCSQEKASLLIDMVLATKPQCIVEIGVFGGKSLIPMALGLKHLGQGKIYGIDPWLASKSAEGMQDENLKWWSNLDHERILNQLLQEIAACKLQNEIQLMRTTSEDCIPIHDIDILHIDGNHSEETSYLDVTKWVPLMKQNGLIIFDDINWETTNKATAWLNQNCIKLAEYRGDNVWGIWIKQ